jgi:hypothetical protein
MKITERIHNIITGEIVDIEREETEYEKENRLAAIALQAEADAKAAQRQALLERLGITEAEAQLLLGGK